MLTSNNSECITKVIKRYYGREFIIASLIISSIAVFNAIDTTSIFLVDAQSQNKQGGTLEQPRLQDPNLKFELVSEIPVFPTNMAFIGPDDILLLSKNDGKVLRIKDGKNLGPVLTIKVSGKDEMGLLGIATESYNNENQNNNNYVFLYYSFCASKAECNNFVYRYNWTLAEGKLVNPQLLLKLPGLPGPSHIGGDIAIGPDGYLYLTVGDLTPSRLFNKDQKYETKAQNYVDGVEADGRGGILRITQDGKPVGNGTIGSTYPLNSYYAYGIKNSFGIGFDPLTGNLWDTENGPSFGDEINLVEPGFNGGWAKVQGFWKVSETGEKMDMVISTTTMNTTTTPSGLVDFGGKGKYSDPKLVWDRSVAPTALVFLNSTKLGSQYSNDMFVGSVENGRLFHFKLIDNRTELLLPNSTIDKILSKEEELSAMFAQNFGIITDLQVGPHDGYLYVVSGDRPNKAGALYRILPK
jgi:aldose sugar dehydrogenase